MKWDDLGVPLFSETSNSKLPSCIRDVALIDLDRQILGVVGIIGQHSVFRNRRGTEKHREAAFFWGGRWMFPKIVGFPPKSSHFNRVFRFSIINHPFWGSPIFGNTQMGRLEPPKLSGTKNRGIQHFPSLPYGKFLLGRSVNKFPGKKPPPKIFQHANKKRLIFWKRNSIFFKNPHRWGIHVISM